MLERRIGQTKVNPIGLGCMGMAAFYGAPLAEPDAVNLLHAALDLGIDHFDTAEMYGMGANERQLGAAFHDRRDKAFIATKFGPRFDFEKQVRLPSDGSETNAVRALEASLKVLRTDHIDLWYLHRRDLTRPIEETVAAMAKQVKAGKVRYIGLSEVSAETLRTAAKVHLIAALQSELSIFTRFAEDEGILSACADLGTTFVAYSPLGRGMLTGAFGKDWKPTGPDFRTGFAPRFSGDAFDHNLALVREIEAVGTEVNATPGQVAIAWVLARAPHIVTIPGTTNRANLEQNVRAADVALSSAQTARLNALAAKVKGERYDEAGMKTVNR